MTEEIRTVLETGKTLKAEIWLLATRWNGSAMVDPSAAGQDTAAWKAGLVACTEKQTATDGDGMSVYTADYPGALTQNAVYEVIFVEGADPEPTAIPVAFQHNPTEYDAVLAMLDDARPEPGQGAPAVNPDAMTKLDYLFKAWRNKSTQTATEYDLYANDGSTVDQKATVSDVAGTATKGKVITGL